MADPLWQERLEPTAFEAGDQILIKDLSDTTDNAVGSVRPISRNKVVTAIAGGGLAVSSEQLLRAALTGDVTAPSGNNATTITNNAVTDAKLRQGGALTVIGNSTNATANVADISASAATIGYVFQKVAGPLLAFGPVITAGITDAAVTYAKIQNVSAAAKLLGRNSATAGPPEEITLGSTMSLSGTTLDRAALTGDVTTSGNAATIGSQKVTTAMLASQAASTVLGRDSGSGPGSPAALTVAGGLEMTGTGGIQRSAFTGGDVTASAASATLTVANNAVTYAKMQDVAALSVVGNATNASTDPAAITASADGQVLQRSGTVLQFGQVVAAGIASAAVTYAKIQNASALTVLGNPTNAAAAPTEIAAATDFHVLRRSGLSVGFGTIGAASIVDGSMTYAKFQNVSALAVLGNGTNAATTPGEIVAGNDFEVLRRSGTGIAFGTIGAGSLANDAVTYAKMQNAVASSKLIGSGASGAGADLAEISLGTALSMSGTTLNGTDDVAKAGSTMTGALTLGSGASIDAGGKEIANHLLKVVSVAVPATLTTTAHSGNVIKTSSGSGTITIPTTAGFHCTLIAGVAHTLTFNATVTAAIAAGDVVSLVVESATIIHAMKTASASKMVFT